ncbi:MAG TPA: hypothetical protein PK189_08845, partial [bacterium]|nr:hypothetical protein [bacterium]
MLKIVCVIFFSFIFYLFAEEVKYYDYIGPFVGYNYFCNNSNHKDEVKFGLNFERYLKKEPISVQVSFGYVPLKIKIPSERKDIYSLGIDAIYNYKAFNFSNLKISPYLSGGVNQNFFDENTFGI